MARRGSGAGSSGADPESSGRRSGNVIIEIDNLTVAYPLGSEDSYVVALHEVSLDIDDGEFVTILGPSGCGKTTLLKILGGLIEHSSGNISINGQPVKNALKARKLGFVFQNPRFSKQFYFDYYKKYNSRILVVEKLIFHQCQPYPPKWQILLHL